jgi:hypothetical protein
MPGRGVVSFDDSELVLAFKEKYNTHPLGYIIVE